MGENSEALADIVEDILGRADCAELHEDQVTHNDELAMLLRSIADRVEAACRNAYNSIDSAVCAIEDASSDEVTNVRRAMERTIGEYYE